MAGYWGSSFSVRSMTSHLDRTSLVNKGHIIWSKYYTKEFRFGGNKAGNPELKELYRSTSQV